MKGRRHLDCVVIHVVSRASTSYTTFKRSYYLEKVVSTFPRKHRRGTIVLPLCISSLDRERMGYPGSQDVHERIGELGNILTNL
jgi:hypothetical protein